MAIREQELNLVTTLNDNDEIRVLNNYDNMRIKLSSFKSVLGMESKLNVADVSQVTLTAAKNYVDNKVKTNVPEGAVFTDTITTINGKTGVITKADITALGIPASDTNTTYNEITTAEIDLGTGTTLRVLSGRRAKYILDRAKAYADSLEPDLNDITTSIIALQSGKVDNSRVLTDVPTNAKFTDTLTTINGKTGAITKADITALGIPASDTNTTYSEITTSEINAGTSTTLRTLSGRRVKYILDKADLAAKTYTDNAVGDVDFSAVETRIAALETWKDSIEPAEGVGF